MQSRPATSGYSYRFIAFFLLLAGCASPGPAGEPATGTALPINPPVTTPSLPPPQTQAIEITGETSVSGRNEEEAIPTGSATDSPPATLPAAGSGELASPVTLSAARPGTAEGIDLVGHHALDAVGWHAGLALMKECAYVGNRRSRTAAIVDISDPAAPVLIGIIPFGPQGQPIELRTLPERNLLVVADHGNQRLTTFEVSNCAQPVPLSALALPGAPHDFTLWTDGEQVLVFGAMFDQSDSDLIVVDVTDPARPAIIARWSSEEEGFDGLLHSLSVSADGRRAYLAMWNSGVLVADLDLPDVRVLRDSDGLIRPAQFVAAHTATPLQNADPPTYLLVTSEIWVCPFSGVSIVSMADPAQPYLVSTLALPENRCENRPAEDAVFTAHYPLVIGNLVFLSWFAAGVQVIDVDDPLAPQRVAQFVPSGDGVNLQSYIGSYPVQTWSYPILRDGLLYVVDIQSGLYILRYTGPDAETVNAVPWAETNVITPP